MAQISKVEWSLGKDVYGRPVRLIMERDGGQSKYSIISQPISQRDDGEHIRSLTRANIEELLQALKTDKVP